MNELLSKVYFTQLWEDLSNVTGFRSWDEIGANDQQLVVIIVGILGITFISLLTHQFKKRQKLIVEQKVIDAIANLSVEKEDTPTMEDERKLEALLYNKSDIQILNLENMERVRNHLDVKLNFIFNQFIITRLLFIFKQFGSVSIENAQKTKQEFIDLFEASLTEFEKEQFKKIFDNFPAFKLYVVQFYNIKLVKLELLITHKVELEETEFKDYKLINSLCNDLTKKDLKNILDILQ